MISLIEREIHRIDEHLKHIEPDETAYGIRLERIKTLLEIEALEMKNRKSKTQQVLENAPLLQLLGSFGVAAMVLNYERTGTILSRAWSIVRLK